MSDDVFIGSRAVARGELTWGRLRGPAFQRVLPDVYAPAGVPAELPLRSRAAHLLVAGRGGVLAGYSAAWALGADVAPAGAPAEVLVPARYRRHPGLVVHEGVTDEVVQVRGLRVTVPLRTAWDLTRRLRRVEAVVALDALARAGRFEPAELLARRAMQPGARGCRRLDDVVALADPRAESPPETRLRILLVDAGLPNPEVQYAVLDEHGFVLARTDLAYPDGRLAIEYDGALHFTRRQRERDLQRDSMLAARGWLTLRFGRATTWTRRRPRGTCGPRSRGAPARHDQASVIARCPGAALSRVRRWPGAAMPPRGVEPYTLAPRGGQLELPRTVDHGAGGRGGKWPG